MPLPIKIKRSLTNRPTNLEFGELAWSDSNLELYIGDKDNVPYLLNSSAFNEGSPLSLLQLANYSEVTLPTSFAPFVFSSVLSRTNPNQLNIDSTNNSTINIDLSGYYLIYFSGNFGITSNSVFYRLLKNGSEIVNNLQVEESQSSDLDEWYSNKVFLDVFSAGDTLRLETQCPQGTLSNCILTIINLSGNEGVQGEKGEKGEKGTAGSGIFSIGNFNADGTTNSAFNLNCARSRTGIYNYTFDTPAESSFYTVLAQAISNTSVNAVETEIYNKTTTGFTIRINVQDDGGEIGANRDSNHNVLVADVSTINNTESNSFNDEFLNDLQYVYYSQTEEALVSNNILSIDEPNNDIRVNGDVVVNIDATEEPSTPFRVVNDTNNSLFRVIQSNQFPNDVAIQLLNSSTQAINFQAFQGTINCTVGYFINGLPLDLNNLATVNITNPTAEDVLTFNGSEWINQASNNNNTSTTAIVLKTTNADLTRNYNVTTPIKLIFSATPISYGDTSTFSYNSSTGILTCNFDGAIEVNYNMPLFSNSVRPAVRTSIQKNNIDEGGISYCYIRNTANHRYDDNSGQAIINVNIGDEISISCVRAENTTQTGAVTIIDTASANVKRIV